MNERDTFGPGDECEYCGSFGARPVARAVRVDYTDTIELVDYMVCDHCLSGESTEADPAPYLGSELQVEDGSLWATPDAIGSILAAIDAGALDHAEAGDHERHRVSMRHPTGVSFSGMCRLDRYPSI